MHVTMDGGGSFLDLACIRIAIVPAGPMSDARFSFLASQIAALDQLPTNALPKPQQSPRRNFLTNSSGAAPATYSGLPADLRNFLQSQAAPAQNSSFSRSRSLTPQVPPRRTHSLSPPRNSTANIVAHPAPSKSPPPVAAASAASAAGGPSAAGGRSGGSSWPGACGDSDAAVRLRYISVHRDPSGSLLVRPPSEWDTFQCRRIWGVIGVVDGTEVGSCSTREAREHMLGAARAQFTSALDQFHGAAVSRLIVFTTSDIALERGSFVTVVSGADGDASEQSIASGGGDESGSGATAAQFPPVAMDAASAATAIATATGIPIPNSPLSISSRAAVMAAGAAAESGGLAEKLERGRSGISPAPTSSSRVEANASSASSQAGPESVPSDKASSPESVVTSKSAAPVGYSGSVPGLPSAAPKMASFVSGTGGPPISSPTSTAAASMIVLNGVGDVARRPISVGFVPILSGAHAEEAKLEIRAQIVHFAGLLMSALESWVHEETVTTDVFISPLDDGSATDKQSKLVRRRPGRLDKLHGDYFLMTGNPSEALMKYNSAVERAKANGDSLWLAGAMEGSCAAQVYDHVSTGRRCDDPALVSRIVEQYAEVYKLYRKKRVPELEAASALRLAEFLGRWTSRRKECLDAMECAATVGEGLRAPKKQILWEALAHFSEFMGCRRKTALFLYRLGLLEANQECWNKAVSLMTASAAQFRTKSRSAESVGAWPDLHRRVLLEAASAGRLAGNPSESARHFVEALSLSKAIHFTFGESDSTIVNSLIYGGHVPAWLASAKDLVTLTELTAVQMGALSVQVHQPNLMRGSTSSVGSADGGKDPFLYNPFAAREAAARAAEAGRAVTWVCGEMAQVDLTVLNSLRASVTVEVVAVSIGEAGREADVWPLDSSGNFTRAFVEEETGKFEKDVVVEELGEVDEVENLRTALSVRTKRMRSMLRAIGRISTTISQSLNLAPMSRGSDEEQKHGTSKFRLSVVPRRPGTMRVCGVVLRLFSGAIVMLPTPAVTNNGVGPPPIEVMSPLPKLDVSIQAEAFTGCATPVSPLPIDIYEGEHRRLTVRVSNSGSDGIAKARIQSSCSATEVVRFISGGSDPEVLSEVASLDCGACYEFEVQVYAVRSATNIALNERRVVSLTVDVEYTGRKRASHLRTTASTVEMNVSPAIYVERLSHVRYFFSQQPSPVPPKVRYEESCVADRSLAVSPSSRPSEESKKGVDESELSSPAESATVHQPSLPALGMVVDVGTLAVAPVLVSIDQTSEQVKILGTQIRGELEGYKSTLVEPGACARLLTPLVVPSGGEVELSSPCGGKECNPFDSSNFSLKWSLPSLGRNGIIPLLGAEVRKVISDSNICPVKEEHVLDLSPTSASLFRNLAASVKIAIRGRVETFSGTGSATETKMRGPETRDGVNASGSSHDIGGGAFDGDGACGSIPGAKTSPGNFHGAEMLVTTRRFYQIQVEIRNTGSTTFPPSSTLDVSVCQLDRFGRYVPVGLGVLVGGHMGVACGGLPPGESRWHSLLMRLSSAGLFDIVANVYDTEANIRSSSLDEFVAGKEPWDGGHARSPGPIDLGVPRLSPTSSPAASPIASSPASPATSPPAMSPAPDVASSPGSSLALEQGSQQSSSQRSSLKRVGLTRRRRSETGGIPVGSPRLTNASAHQTRSPLSLHAVRPFAAGDVSDSVLSQRKVPPISTGHVTVQAVNDTRWSTGGLLEASPSAGAAGPESSEHAVIRDAHRHLHGPDTIVH